MIATGLLALLVTLFTFLAPAAAGIAPAKEDIVLVIDNSNGMKQLDVELTVADTIKTFLGAISRDVEVALILFDDNASLKAPFAPLGDTPSQALLRGLEIIDYGGRFSNSSAAIERALHELSENGRPGAGKSIIVLAQDRIDTGNEAQDLNFTRWLSDVLAEQAAKSRIRIFSIALSGIPDSGLLQNLARLTGGEAYAVSNSSELPAAFDRLTADIFSTPLASAGAPPAANEDSGTAEMASGGTPDTAPHPDRSSAEAAAAFETAKADTAQSSVAGTEAPSSPFWPRLRGIYDWAIRNWVLILGLAVAVGLLGIASKLRRQSN